MTNGSDKLRAAASVAAFAMITTADELEAVCADGRIKKSVSLQLALAAERLRDAGYCLSREVERQEMDPEAVSTMARLGQRIAKTMRIGAVAATIAAGAAEGATAVAIEHMLSASDRIEMVTVAVCPAFNQQTGDGESPQTPKGEFASSDNSPEGSIGRDLANRDLSGFDLTGSDLADADLRHANLVGADLSGANLANADLRFAVLEDAQLSDADLSDAKLYRANASRASFRNANLSFANLGDTDLTEADFTGADMTGADLTLAQTEGTIGLNQS